VQSEGLTDSTATPSRNAYLRSQRSPSQTTNPSPFMEPEDSSPLSQYRPTWPHRGPENQIHVLLAHCSNSNFNIILDPFLGPRSSGFNWRHYSEYNLVLVFSNLHVHKPLQCTYSTTRQLVPISINTQFLCSVSISKFKCRQVQTAARDAYRPSPGFTDYHHSQA
jgi:hypothetical protein